MSIKETARQFLRDLPIPVDELAKLQHEALSATPDALFSALVMAYKLGYQEGKGKKK